MTNYLRSLITAAVLPFALSAAGANLPPMPPNLEVPAGHTMYLKTHAVGTQNYICRSSGGGFAWTLFGPQATLFVTFKWLNGEIRQQVATHFLSPNPDEAGLARATWQSSLDTSATWAKAIANSVDPAYVAQGAIPWLLLQVVGGERGPAGGDLLSGTTYLQRLNTSGGIAPPTGCTQASNLGDTVLVPYTTDYFFYKAIRPR